MNRRRVFTGFASAGLVLVSAASVLASDGIAHAAAPATAVSSADWSDTDGAALPAVVTPEWWGQVQPALRQLSHPYRAVTGPSGARPKWKADSDQEDARFGWSVGKAGDVNADGYDDVIVGAPYYDDGQLDEGRAFVFHGSPSGPSTSPDWTAEINQAGAHFGFSVDTAGDINGDGYDDVIVGAPDYESRQLELNEGGAFAYYGSASGLSLTPDWAAESNQGGAHFGDSVGTAGDINGDGYDDLIVGAYFYSNGQFLEGRAFEYHGSASGLSTSPDWTAESNQMHARFGVAVGTAGDVNGDGYDDVIVGAPFYFDEQPFEGWVFVYHGSASGLSASCDWAVDSAEEVYSYFGSAVGTAGDVNGDGYDDVIVGAPGYDRGEGRAFVYHGSGQGLSVGVNWVDEESRIAGYGTSVATAGDVNGDGYADVVVGAPGYDDDNHIDEGRAFLYYGSASGLSRTRDCTAKSNQAFASFGQSVSTAGDVNGDGYDDVIVGASDYDHGELDEGGVVVFRGRATELSPR